MKFSCFAMISCYLRASHVFCSTPEYTFESVRLVWLLVAGKNRYGGGIY